MDISGMIPFVLLFLISDKGRNGRCQADQEDQIHLLQGGIVTHVQTRESDQQSQCLQNEYGPNCTYCVPSDTCEKGHFSCDVNTGTKVCLPGYHGGNCDLSSDPVTKYHVTCPENTCRNGGTCSSGRCCCRTGFTGILCEIEIIECTDQSCLNGGICKDLIGKFECLCQPSFLGTNCEISIDTHIGTTPSRDSGCQSKSCKNNGTCLEDTFLTYCLCPTYYVGENCETHLGKPSGLTSVCPVNYFGNGCKTYCKPQDNCFGHYVCDGNTGDKICLSGWHGQNCDIRVIPQRVDPLCPKHGCKNDGQCFNKLCCCRNNYTGDYCQVESIGCLSNPCKNNATCMNQGNGFVCICQANFTGKACENDVTRNTLDVTTDTNIIYSNAFTSSASTVTKVAQHTLSQYSIDISPTLSNNIGETLHSIPLSFSSGIYNSSDIANAASSTYVSNSEHYLPMSESYSPIITPVSLTPAISTSYFDTFSSTSLTEVQKSLKSISTNSGSESVSSLSESSSDFHVADSSSLSIRSQNLQESKILRSKHISVSVSSSEIYPSFPASTTSHYFSRMPSPVLTQSTVTLNFMNSNVIQTKPSDTFVSVNNLLQASASHHSDISETSAIVKDSASLPSHTVGQIEPTASYRLYIQPSVSSTFETPSLSTFHATSLQNILTTLRYGQSSSLSYSNTRSYYLSMGLPSSNANKLLKSSSSTVQTSSDVPYTNQMSSILPEHTSTFHLSISTIASSSSITASLKSPTSINTSNGQTEPQTPKPSFTQPIFSTSADGSPINTKMLYASSLASFDLTVSVLTSSFHVPSTASHDKPLSILTDTSNTIYVPNTKIINPAAVINPNHHYSRSVNNINITPTKTQNELRIEKSPLSDLQTVGKDSDLTQEIRPLSVTINSGPVPLSTSYAYTKLTTTLIGTSQEGLTITPTKSLDSVTESTPVGYSSETVVITDLNTSPDDSGLSEGWQIALVVIACVLVLAALIILIVFLSIRQRRKDSRTISHSPSEIQGYSKEHFSEQPDFKNPDFNNPTYDVENDSDDDSIKYDIYVVNE